MVVYSSVSVDTAACVRHPRKKCAPHTERSAIIVGPRIILNGNTWNGAKQISFLETSINDVCTIYVTTMGLMKTTTVVTPGCIRKRGAYAKCRMLVNGKQLAFQIDTGATVNVLPARYARDVVPYSGVLTMWNKTMIKPLGKCWMLPTNPKRRHHMMLSSLSSRTMTSS